jgi:hypothetical protein
LSPSLVSARPRARRRLVLPLALLASAAGATQASAAQLVSTTVSAGQAADRTCAARSLDASPGVASTTVVAPATGWIVARLDGGQSGDWDVAVFEQAGGSAIAGSQHADAKEVASGLVFAGERLTVQACRVQGGADSARLTVESVPVDTTTATAQSAS